MPSPLPLSFRRLVANDAAAFRDLRIAGIVEHPEYFGTSVSDEEAGGLPLFEKRIAGSQEGEAVFGAFRGARLVGVAGFYRVSSSSTMRHRGDLWGVFVVPEERGGETAERLIRTVIGHARQHVDVLTGHVTTTNVHARKFYSRLGFGFSGIETKNLKVGGRYYDQEILVMDFTATSSETPPSTS
jgi:ribosomal protein S18 acetylase RimI-like enzyme